MNLHTYDPFKADEACAKCGSDGLTIEYRGPVFIPYVNGCIPESLLVKCLRCGYQWNRAPLDAGTGA